jgi:8-oxo-dGTP diphosphatase
MYRHGEHGEPLAYRAAGCFCFCHGRLLLIERAASRPLPLHWGVPTGKLEPGETARQAAVRELGEEVGLRVDLTAPDEVVGATVIDRSTAFFYTSFQLEFAAEPDLRLADDEVRSAAWVEPEAIAGRRLVPFFYNTLNDVMEWRRHGALALRAQAEKEAPGPA